MLEQTIIDWFCSPGELSADLCIRELEPTDRGRVLAVIDGWWGRPMSAMLPRAFFGHFRDSSFVIEQGEELVAFLVGFLSQAEAGEAYIHAVAVAPELRRRGLGRLLYRHFIDVVSRRGAVRVRAITSQANSGSLAFHRRLGFSVENPKGEDVDARVELVLELPPPPIADLAGATDHVAAAALRVPLGGTLVALEPLERRHADDLWLAAEGNDWTFVAIDCTSRAAFDRWLDRALTSAGD